METNPLLLLGFLASFHIIGAVAVGTAARGIWRVARGEGGSVGGSVFFAVWGGFFGCMPLAFGLDPALPNWMLPAQLLIWATAFVITAFFAQTVREWARPLFTINTGLMIFGGIFMLAGLVSGYVSINGEKDFLAGIIISGVFGAIGFGIFLLGLVNLLKNLRS